MKKTIRQIVFILFFTLVLTSCTSSGEAFSETGFYFDTAVTFTFYGNDKDYLQDCLDMCGTYDAMFDRFDPSSEISLLNMEGTRQVSDDMVRILKEAAEFSETGRFTPAVAPLLDLWGFSDQNYRVPEEKEIEALLPGLSASPYTINTGSGTVILHEDTLLDLGGIAKGYAADRICEYLEQNGVQSALLNIGASTIVMLGSKPDGSSFKIGLQTPFSASGSYDHIFEGSGCAISSSGPYERYFETDGKVYHQIIDPRTGWPAASGLNGVTVITDSASRADVLSTEIFILGLEEGMGLVEHLDGVEAIFFDKNNQVTLSSGLIADDQIIHLKGN